MTTSAGELSRMQAVPVPARMSHLPLDPVRNVPVPWFVVWQDGKPEFRIADGDKRVLAVQKQLCWLCGEPLVPPSVFVLGPMCGLNRISAEPPCHPECALYAVRACPFLCRPRLERRGGIDPGLLAQSGCDGVMIQRNPGCVALWVTRGYMVVVDDAGGWLCGVGDCHSVTWWCEGRPATRAEVLTSIVTGLPHLKLPDDPHVWEEVAKAWVALDPFLPPN